ncbi:uncharacterized protein TNCV_817431 [Trichonephila clavipes]|nr:uncharacterized protein TNCV_817431 [Trichonephila clavipes]
MAHSEDTRRLLAIHLVILKLGQGDEKDTRAGIPFFKLPLLTDVRTLSLVRFRVPLARRVLPQTHLSDLRKEINRQLGIDSVPQTFVFLRSVGRNFTQVRPKQEMEMKVKNYIPPFAQNEIAVVPDFHKRILFSDEAHFWLNGYVNKQNCRIWSEANPQVHVETPLHPEKLTVWCALWAGGILLQKR